MKSDVISMDIRDMNIEEFGLMGFESCFMIVKTFRFNQINFKLEVSENRGTPTHHPFLGIFHETYQPSWDTPKEIPMSLGPAA